jgi:D-glycero-D-manno-heptose 1,7-bisphosphate phosphatase
MKCAVFLDRDGVLNRNVWNPATNQYESPLTPEQFELLPDVLPALRLLCDAGYLLFLVSNQPNYAKGKASMDMLNAIHCRLETALTEAKISFAAFYYCFHHPEFTGECMCRKPSPYFLFQARDIFGVHLGASWIVGDRATDVECGRSAGMRTIEISDSSASTTKADYAAAGLWSAARIIMSV